VRICWRGIRLTSWILANSCVLYEHREKSNNHSLLRSVMVNQLFICNLAYRIWMILYTESVFISCLSIRKNEKKKFFVLLVFSLKTVGSKRLRLKKKEQPIVDDMLVHIFFDKWNMKIISWYAWSLLSFDVWAMNLFIFDWWSVIVHLHRWR